MTDEALFASECSFLDQQNFSVQVNLDIRCAIALIAQLQLASRHPGNRGETRGNAEAVARSIQKAIGVHSADLERLLEKGWHPVFDVPQQPAGKPWPQCTLTPE